LKKGDPREDSTCLSYFSLLLLIPGRNARAIERTASHAPVGMGVGDGWVVLGEEVVSGWVGGGVEVVTGGRGVVTGVV